jgi:hypothetical protein
MYEIMLTELCASNKTFLVAKTANYTKPVLTEGFHEQPRNHEPRRQRKAANADAAANPAIKNGQD